MYGAFANYIGRYIDEMAVRNVPIWSVTPQNEPEHVGNYETTWMTAAGEATFIAQQLGPKMAARTPAVQVLGFDHNKGTSLQSWTTGLYGNGAAKQYLAGLSTHWYGSSINPFTDSLDFAHDADPSKMLIATEQGLSAIRGTVPLDVWQNDIWFWNKVSPDWACDATGRVCNDAAHPLVVGAYRYAEDIIASLNHWETGWIQWTAVTDKWGGPSHYLNGNAVSARPGTQSVSPYMVDACGTANGNGSCGGVAAVTPVLSGTQAVYDTPVLYVLKHFSKFMLPGARVLPSTIDPSVVTTTRYDSGTWVYNAPDFMVLSVSNPDGSIAVAILNEKTTAVDYQIQVWDQVVESTVSAQALQTLVISP
jgi:glucosylceramidase